jgi:hypothetical protein
MKRYLIILAVLALGACAGTAETRATNALSIACSSYAVTLSSLSQYKKDGKLPSDWLTRIDAANALVDPVCLPGSIVDPATAIGVVNSGIGLLTQVKNSV